MPFADSKERQQYAQKYRQAHREKQRKYCRKYRRVFGAELKQLYRRVHRRFTQAQVLAHRRNLPFTLTREVYERLIKKPCFYCERVTFGKETGCGLDRRNHAKGYVPRNVLSCCGDCNYHRRVTWTVREMKAAATAVNKLRNR